jgi:hypothetical protein
MGQRYLEKTTVMLQKQNSCSYSNEMNHNLSGDWASKAETSPKVDPLLVALGTRSSWYRNYNRIATYK